MKTYTKQIMVLSLDKILRGCIHTPVEEGCKPIIPAVDEYEFVQTASWHQRALDLTESLMKETNITYARIFINASLSKIGRLLKRIIYIMVYDKFESGKEEDANIITIADELGLAVESFKELIQEKRGSDIIERIVDIYKAYDLLYGKTSGSAVTGIFKNEESSSNVSEDTIKRLCKLALMGSSFESVYYLPENEEEAYQNMKKKGEENYWRGINSIKRLMLEGVDLTTSNNTFDYDNVQLVQAVKGTKKKL